MGKLIDGKWHDVWYETDKHDGKFVRDDASFRNWVVPKREGAPSGRAFAPENGRYLLYVSLACPWAHRTLIFRKIKGLEEMIPVSVVHYFMGEQGWSFDDGPGVVADPIGNVDYLHEVYTKAKPDFTGRVTVPVLWDKKEQTIVSNESSEIIRMFNSSFDALGAKEGDYYPDGLCEKIDEINERVYHTVNNGVYKAGFATRQEVYEHAFDELFETMDWLEERLSRQRYLVGDPITEADWRLFTTLLRFDAVYFGHFKCNKRRLVDYPNLWAYARELFQVPGIEETVDFVHIKRHYYQSHGHVNPTRIVPKGPEVDWHAPHGRG